MACEERSGENGNPKRRPRMLAIAVVLPVVALVVVPGILLILGLGRAASREAPVPGDSVQVCRPSYDRQIVGQLQLFRTRDNIGRRLAQVDFN